MRSKTEKLIKKADFKTAYDLMESEGASFAFKDLPNVDAMRMYCFLMYAASRKETAEIHISICNYLYFMEPRITDNDSLIKWHLVRAFGISHDENILKNWIFGVYAGNPDCPFTDDELDYYRSFL